MSLLVIYILLPIIAVWYISQSRKTKGTPHIPYIEFDGDNSPVRYQNETIDLLGKGYNQYHKHGLPFSIRNPFGGSKQPIVILPIKYLEEVKWAPEDRLSFWDYIDRQANMSQVGIPLLSHEPALAARVGLNRALGAKIEAMREACIAAFEKSMPDCVEWTAVVPYPVIMAVFANISAAVMFGPDVGGMGSEWQQLTLGYVNKTIGTLNKVKKTYPTSLLWLSKYLDSGVKSMVQDRLQAAELLRKPLEARLAASDGQTKFERVSRHFEDGIQWLADVYSDKGERLTPDLLQQKLITIVFASIHSTSQAALTLLFDMIEHPETVEEIRQEIDKVRKENPTWTRQALSELRLLDSLMRESARVHATAQVLSMQRVAQTTWTFKDGFSVPAGTIVAFPSYHRGHEPDIHPNPEVFDARRHLRKREAEDTHRYHFGSASDDLLYWGGGTHACPGRFFAQESLRLIFVHLLTHYDFKLSEEDQKMPKMVPMNLILMPNMGLPVLFKERRL